MSAGISIKGEQRILTLGGQNILGTQTKGISLNNELVETSDDNSGVWAEYDAIAGKKTVELPFSGMLKNLELLKASLGTGSQMYAITYTYPDGSVISGDFIMATFAETGEHKTAVTFDCTLQSSGEVIFTPGV